MGGLELRQYRPVDFRTRTAGPPRWAGLLLGTDGGVRAVNLGPVEGTAEAARALLADAEGGRGGGRRRICTSGCSGRWRPSWPDWSGSTSPRTGR